MCLNSCSKASLRETDCLTRTTQCPLNLNVQASTNLFGKSTPYSLTLVSTMPACFRNRFKVDKNSLSSKTNAYTSGRGLSEILFQTFLRRFVEILLAELISGIFFNCLSQPIFFSLFNLLHLAAICFKQFLIFCVHWECLLRFDLLNHLDELVFAHMS